MHPSIIVGGVRHPIPKCTSCCTQYHCPLCPSLKPMTKKKCQAHWEAHVKNAIIFEDKRLCRCHLSCRPHAHYHCPSCNKTVLRRNTMETHLKNCSHATFSRDKKKEEYRGPEINFIASRGPFDVSQLNGVDSFFPTEPPLTVSQMSKIKMEEEVAEREPVIFYDVTSPSNVNKTAGATRAVQNISQSNGVETVPPPPTQSAGWSDLEMAVLRRQEQVLQLQEEYYSLMIKYLKDKMTRDS